MPVSAVNPASWYDWRVGRLGRPARLSLWLTVALGSVPLTPANAQVPVAAAQDVRGESIDDFYAARNGRPLWFDQMGPSGEAPKLLLDLLMSAQADGLNPDNYRSRDLDQALYDAGSGDPDAIHFADRLLSEMFIAYVADLRRTPQIDMIWVDAELRPSVPSPRRLLESAASAPSLESFVANMQWMNPIYVGLRQAMVQGNRDGDAQSDLLRLNLERARLLAPAVGKYVVVNIAAAQLSMIEDGRTVDTMRVVVGKPIHPTPMMAALIRFTSLNPYWNVPADLAAERVAPNVVRDGKAYLDSKGYQLLSGWNDKATVISPDTVDWAAVVARRTDVRLRQLPGPANAMGAMKFMFPNAQGIYLHDTPEKKLLSEEARMFSGGCVRLEDAARLAKWLYRGTPPSTRSTLPEQRVDLPAPVPVYLTYLTAIPTDGGISFLPDVYNRDRAALAKLDGDRIVASR